MGGRGWSGVYRLLFPVYLDGQRLCKIQTDQNQVQSQLYYHADVVGTPLAETDDLGQLVAGAQYYPFGSEVSPGAATDPHKFTGKELDDETGLYYFNARYYDADLGRFISVDPVAGSNTDPQSWNRYAYALDNPIRYRDPSGGQVAAVATAVAVADPAGAALLAAAVAADQATPAQYRMSTFLKVTLALQASLAVSVMRHVTTGNRGHQHWGPKEGKRPRQRPAPQKLRSANEPAPKLPPPNNLPPIPPGGNGINTFVKVSLALAAASQNSSEPEDPAAKLQVPPAPELVSSHESLQSGQTVPSHDQSEGSN